MNCSTQPPAGFIRIFTRFLELICAVLFFGGGLVPLQFCAAGGVSFQNTSPMLTARAYHTATTLLSGKILVAGGKTGTTVPATAEIYDPATGLWNATGSMLHARYSHTATLLANGKVLVACGQAGTNMLASAELYDPTTETWTETGNVTI